MEALKFILFVCISSCLVMTGTEAQSACAASALSDCVTESGISPSDLDGNPTAEQCSDGKKFIECLESKAGDCPSLQGLLDEGKKEFSQVCGGVQFLLSWPLYMAVLALSLQRLYNSLQ